MIREAIQKLTNNEAKDMSIDMILSKMYDLIQDAGIYTKDSDNEFGDTVWFEMEKSELKKAIKIITPFAKGLDKKVEITTEGNKVVVAFSRDFN